MNCKLIWKKSVGHLSDLNQVRTWVQTKATTSTEEEEEEMAGPPVLRRRRKVIDAYHHHHPEDSAVIDQEENKNAWFVNQPMSLTDPLHLFR